MKAFLIRVGGQHLKFPFGKESQLRVGPVNYGLIGKGKAPRYGSKILHCKKNVKNILQDPLQKVATPM